MYEKLITIYQTIINEIWKGIETIASESQKTPPEVIRFQNYHQMHRIYCFYFNFFFKSKLFIFFVQMNRHNERHKQSERVG